MSESSPLRESMCEEAGNHSTSPFGWCNEKEYVGAVNDILAYIRNFALHASAPLPRVFADRAPSGDFDFDVVVIGGGSGGIACAREAAILGARTACLDYVSPSWAGSTWGLGGTCVNVGCIPKKLMHQASLLGEGVKDAPSFGWNVATNGHDWSTLVTSVQDYIKSLNFAYRVDMRDNSVEYINALGKFVGPHEIECTDGNGAKRVITARRVVVAVGGRPKPLSIPGGQHAISSDDIFMHPTAPGKTLVVGASYVALECAGFLKGIGYDVTVLVRSILLRGFDRDMSERIGDHMQGLGINMVYESSPTRIVKDSSGKLTVTYTTKGEEVSDQFDTVLCAVGRTAVTEKLGLAAAGVETDSNGKIIATHEQTNVPHIYAIGDVIAGVPELTPAAIQAGKFLSRRLFGGSTVAMNYERVCTTVFTPLEYSCAGMTEEEATEKLGLDLEVYHISFNPLEWAVVEDRPTNVSYCKLLVDSSDRERVVGLHILCPNAGEVAQGFAGMLSTGATYEDFRQLVGIHPTVAETFTTLTVTKSSGADASAGNC